VHLIRGHFSSGYHNAATSLRLMTSRNALNSGSKQKRRTKRSLDFSFPEMLKLFTSMRPPR